MAELSQPLPLQEKKIFDQLSRAFDNKDYQKAIRLADAILSAQPNHGETLAMKGLCLHTIDKKEEGIATIRAGIAKNMRSSLSWHCFGMVHKLDKNLPEALKSFKQSVKCDEKNVNASRDLSSAAIQLQDWVTFLEIRQKMIAHKSNVRANWIALSCAHRMNGNIELALEVMNIMIQIMDAGDNAAEKSEVHLYRAELELVLKRPSRALEILKIHDADISDNSEKLILRAKAHAMAGQKEKSEKLFFDLIQRGISEADCLAEIAKLRGVDMDDRTHLPRGHASQRNVDQLQTFVQLCDHIVEKVNAKCDCARRLPLDCTTDADFGRRLESYFGPFIQKQIPSVTSVLKSLYVFFEAKSARIVEIGTILHRWEKELLSGDRSTFPEAATNPTLLLWTYQALASHYLRIGDFVNAMLFAEKAVNHTPSHEMLYLLKAKILLREKKFTEAAECADIARKLDLQDKYLNNKAAKYYFRAGDVEKAESLMKLFMKDDEDPSSVYLTAIEYQTVWYERECGDAFMRRGDAISALQNYLLFERHNKDNHDELIEFHNYTFRRCNMRQWFEVQDKQTFIGEQRFYQLACPRLARAFVKIAVDGEEAAQRQHVPRPSPTTTAPSKDKMSDEEKARFKVYDDLFIKHVDISGPLLKARRYVDSLLQYCPMDPQTHATALDYALAHPTDAIPFAAAAHSLQKLADLSKPLTPEGTSVSLSDQIVARAELQRLGSALRAKWISLPDKDSIVADFMEVVFKKLELV